MAGAIEYSPLTYAILEGNMERLEKKLTRIEKKCQKYGCQFHFKVVGEEHRKLSVGEPECEPIMAKFYIVEAEGLAIINDWRFIASIEHTPGGNIIRGVTGVEVPQKYFHTGAACEHCQRIRSRKDTYLVQNVGTGEFKQVGKSCLKDFTNGLDAAAAAQLLDAMEEVIHGEAPMEGYRVASYIGLNDWLRYVAETVRHFGYVKRDSYDSANGATCTADRAEIFYCIDNNLPVGVTDKARRQYCDEMEKCGFNANSKAAASTAAAALAWLAEQEAVGNYMNNLKAACSLQWLGHKHLGLTASLIASYNLSVEREEKKKQKDAQAALEASRSQWVGEVGKRIDIKVAEMTCITGWDTAYGYTMLRKIVDVDGNVYTWKTSSFVEDGVEAIRGTVKSHSEYRGVKQTELTRCKCSYGEQKADDSAVPW